MKERPSVLIVDDTPSNIKILNELLKGCYKIYVATSGEDALDIVAQREPDIILLDIKMPEMDGYEVCRQLKSSETTSKIPIIFITAKSDEIDEQHGLELGAVDYISKPFSKSIVKARVSNHIELKEARDNLEALVNARTRELCLANKQLGMYVKELEGRAELARLQTSGIGQSDAVIEICRIILGVIGASKVVLFNPNKKTKELIPIVLFDPSSPDKAVQTNITSESIDTIPKEVAIQSMQQEKLICHLANNAATPLIFNDEVLAVIWVEDISIDNDISDNFEILQRLANESASALRWVKINEDILFDQMDLNEFLKNNP